MNLIAIDPGPEKSAFVYITNGKLVMNRAIFGNNHLLEWIKTSGPFAHAIAIEKIASMGMAVGKSVFETCYWTGRFDQACGGRATRITRHEIKMHLCGTMRSNDGDIRRAMIKRWGEQGTKKSPGPTYGIHSHIWSALAVATTYLDKYSVKEKQP